ncbi:hypothetical protein H2248_010993 [Termitomyces sp. 'cryptogamus']|nr:hypothetical protein H2248_010993 [Termitomyces sp. 'cryptogamus']
MNDVEAKRLHVTADPGELATNGSMDRSVYVYASFYDHEELVGGGAIQAFGSGISADFTFIMRRGCEHKKKR